ncbi:MAG TPA: hypothetical protein VNQ76_15730 [Planctomicrobium sp.]|nr:hypothetical protein [Planctomicrobium sp.]
MAISTGFADGWTPDERTPPVAGLCHAVVTNVMENGDGKSSDMIIEFEVVAHSVPMQEGTIHREYCPKKMKMMWLIHRLAVAIGLITVEQQKEHQKNGTAPEYDFESCIGRHVMIGLQDEEYEGKVRVKAAGRYYHPDNSRCVKWPKNISMLTAAGHDVKSQETAKSSAPALPDDAFNGVV